MKVKLYMKWCDLVAKQWDSTNHGHRRGRLLKMLDFMAWKPILDFRRMIVMRTGIAKSWWSNDRNGLRTKFREKYAKYSRRYYDPDSILKREIASLGVK